MSQPKGENYWVARGDATNGRVAVQSGKCKVQSAK